MIRIFDKARETIRLPGVRPLLVVFSLLVLVAGCAGNDEEYDLTRDIREAYIEAQDAMAVGNYRKSIAIFEALQARFPFSRFATQIQLELSYCYYKEGRVEQAIDAADTFLREKVKDRLAEILGSG